MNHTGEKAIDATEKQRQALELRKAGATFEQIAKQLDYATHVGAMKAVKSALKKVLREPAEELRQMEVERLDALMLPLWKQARDGNQGAVDRILKIMERRAKLLGLDAPVKQEHSGTIGIKGYAIVSPDDWDKAQPSTDSTI